MTTVDIALVRITHDGRWAEYVVKYSDIPNHGHVYFPADVSVELIRDVFEDMLNSGGPDAQHVSP